MDVVAGVCEGVVVCIDVVVGVRDGVGECMDVVAGLREEVLRQRLFWRPCGSDVVVKIESFCYK